MKKKNVSAMVNSVKVYLALLQLGKSTASEIADKSELRLIDVHLALCDLIQQKLVEVRFTEKMKREISLNLDRMIAGKPPLRFKQAKWYAV